MVATLANEPLTFDELMGFLNDGNHYEIINGELLVSLGSSLDHQGIVGNIFRLFDRVVEQPNAGSLFFAPATVRFSNYTVVQPDLLFVRADRWDKLNAGEFIAGAPDIVVEVVSPSSASYDRVRKFGRYADNQVAEYWIVDPKRQDLMGYTLIDGLYQSIAVNADGSLTSQVLPELIIHPAKCFENLGSS